MSNLVLSATVFQVLAAVSIFGLMIVGAVGAVQRKRQNQATRS